MTSWVRQTQILFAVLKKKTVAKFVLFRATTDQLSLQFLGKIAQLLNARLHWSSYCSTEARSENWKNN